MRSIAVLTIAAAVALAGCGSNDPTAGSPVAASSSSPSPTTPSRPLSPRGNDLRKPGDTIGWRLKDGSGNVTAVLDNFVVSASCVGGGRPKNGAYLTFDLRVVTPPSPLVVDMGAFFHRDGYSVVGPDGVTVRHLWTDSTYSCAEHDGQWTDDLGPGATYQGKVVLDVPVGSTVLAFNPTGNDAGGGDEWLLPVN